MTVFKKAGKSVSGIGKKPPLKAVPSGGHGSGGPPSRAMRKPYKNAKPSGGAKGTPAYKPSGGWGSHGKPKNVKSKPRQSMRAYASDGSKEPKTPIPKDQMKGRFNLPKGNFKYV